MSVSICPRCHIMLAPISERPENFRCGTCRGEFRPPPSADSNPTDESDSAHSAALVSTAPLDRDVPPVPCPNCLTHMRPGGRTGDFVCSVCASRWSDGDAFRLKSMSGSAVAADSPATASLEAASPLSPLTRSLLYGVSLPERLLRSGVGLTAGMVKEAAGFLVPQAFQTSKSYEIAIENSLKFLTETIGGVTGPTTGADEAGEQIARKAVGNFVDLAGLATLHVSPMWMLAVVSDVAYGGRTYVMEVARELKEQGVIDETSTIYNVDDILVAIQRASGSAASTFDTPPLSVDELRKTIEQTRADLRGADVTRLIPEPELRRMWTEMHTLATQEGVSLLGVSSAVTMQTLERVKTVSNGTLTGVRVAGGLLNRNVLGHYQQALGRIREKGFYEIVRESYEPYVEAVWNNFSAERKTWTESLLDPTNISNAIGKVFSFLGQGQQDRE